MNQSNYVSREAAQCLVDAGIVLETDFYWARDGEGWYFRSDGTYYREVLESIPAPSFTEVWRELEKNTIFYGADLYFSFNFSEFGFYTNSAKFSDGLGRINSPTFMSDNPTDALIDLLVWLKGEGK